MYKYKECMVAQTQKFKIMYFHIMSSDNKSVISGELVLMRPHTTCSEINKTQCFLVYMHNVLINENLFPEWSKKHLKYNKALGSGGIKATSEYDYIEFSLGNFRNDYDFMITDTRH
jgi:hypothetical protein